MPARAHSPPTWEFSLILASAVAQVYVLTLVDRFFRATGVPPTKFGFALSRNLAELAAFVNTPVGMLFAGLAIFAWCRCAGWIIKMAMRRGAKPEGVGACVEPLLILENGAAFGLMLLGVILPMAHFSK